MKINNKSKVAMAIFHQARRQIALIAVLLGQFADKQRTKSDAPKSECPNFTFGNTNVLLGAFIFCSSNFPCGHL